MVTVPVEHTCVSYEHVLFPGSVTPAKLLAPQPPIHLIPNNDLLSTYCEPDFPLDLRDSVCMGVPSASSQVLYFLGK